jgi:undecaprenyl-phosphate 4-deoxy-4-formamido-L-arabinose transferase
VYSYYEDKKHHWFRNFGSWATNACATFLLDKPRDLYLCSFRGMRRELVERIIKYKGPYPYVDGLILGATNRIDRMLVDHVEREDGQSGYTLRKLVRLWMNMFFNFSVMPLRAASVLGGVLCGLGIVMLIAVLAEHFILGRPTPGWSSLMAVVSIFSGAQLLILGLMGEYLGRAYMTVSGKPQSLVRQIISHHPPQS